jgi:hypothetical protein
MAPGRYVRDLSSVVARALSFFGPGELQALRVEDPDIFRVVLTMMQGSAPTSQMARALNSLCAIELLASPQEAEDVEDGRDVAVIIERCAATVTELKGLPADLLCESGSSHNPCVLARCIRLELLTVVRAYTPAVWLGLSQLHTLHGVDLERVPVATIAAALPRLTTLTAFRYSFASASGVAAGFFTDLLPRLRVFQFDGTWPAADANSVVAPTEPLLPQLEELVWREFPPMAAVFRGFRGARPIVLDAPYELITECLPRGGAPYEPARGFLARVCELRFSRDTAPLAISDVAHVLRAAPRLRTFRCPRFLHGDTLFLTASAVPLDSSFVGLVHPRLRLFELNVIVSCRGGDGCASRLRRTCFPRLREMKVNDETYFVTSAAPR